MPAKATTYSNSLLALVFNGTTFANVAINATTSPVTNLYVSLHTTSPGAGGVQSTGEAAYSGYSRVAVTRTSGGWTVNTNSVVPAATVTFPACSGGSAETESFFAVGLSSTGAGVLLYYGTVSPVIAVSTGKMMPHQLKMAA